MLRARFLICLAFVESMSTMSTRGWVTVNICWVITRGQDEFRIVPPEQSSEKFQLCPHASSFHKTEADKIPNPIHVSLMTHFTHCLKITQNVAFEFLTFGVFRHFLSY